MSGRRIGNYLITDYLGSGGFGTVFKGEDVNTPGRIVAIKELHKKHTRNAHIKQRFFQEAVAMARLDHPNLPRLYTFGEDNGSYYLVMEFIQGRPLSDELSDLGPLPPAKAVAVLSQILLALGYAHRNGIIHRDLKPDNIVLIEEGGNLKVKVLDFGIARMVGGESLTMTGEGFGTPAYMSPERMSGEAGDDPRIDIYSAGIILYQMLAGRTPFESKASDPVVYWTHMRDQHERQPMPAIEQPGVPPALDEVMRRATAKRIEERYASADDMLADMDRVGEMKTAAGAAVGSARLLLTTAPGGAEVYVDNRLRGTSDAVRGKILVEGLAPGLHSVRVSKEGYDDYRISVALEQEGQTDLHVTLPARATVIVPAGDQTAVGGFETLKMHGAGDRQTAVLVVEDLPEGASVRLDSGAVAEADEEGRATLRLPPGNHEIQIMDRSGEITRRVVTVAERDAAAYKTISVATEKVPARPRSNRRMAAIAVALILLLAAGAAAYFATRTPAESPTEARIQSTAPAQPQPSASGEAAPSSAAATTPSAETTASADAAKLEEERKRAEAQAESARAAKEKEAVKSTVVTPEATATVPQAPATPAVQPVPVPQEACAGVRVTGPGGMPMRGASITMTEAPGTPGARSFNGHVGPKGNMIQCGLKAGSLIRVAVFGAKGALRATREAVLRPGRNFIEIQFGDDPDISDPDQRFPNPRRPRRPRP